MKIPSKIKIGGHWFRIEYKDDKKDGYDKDGSRWPWSCFIRLNKAMEQSKKESTLLHEIIHEIDWQHDIGLNEIQVSTIAEGLYQVLIDNKLLK